MDQDQLRILTSCLDFPENLVITNVAPTVTYLELHLACQNPVAACPLCQQCSEQVHSRYLRTVADVPCGARRVILSLTVRKFVCSISTCPRKIFTERLPELVETYARKTIRLISTLQAIGLAAGGETGTRLAEKVGIQTKPSTLLCHVMALPLPDAPKVRVLGVDDWSWKKGRRYGTVLVDLERRKIIDVLPDRKASTLADWLREHSEVEVISRDRGTDYAAAAREAAPQAIQIADRFHLVRNIAEVLQLLLARIRSEIRRAGSAALVEHLKNAEPAPMRTLPDPTSWKQDPPAQMVRKYQARQQEREDRFQQIQELRAAGMKQTDIAERVGIAERTVRTWLKAEAPPSHRRPTRRSCFDPYAAYVLSRWHEGIHEDQQLFEEIRAQGFKGSVRVVGRFLQTLREKRCPLTDLPPPTLAEQFSANAAAWLFIRQQTDLTEEEQKTLQAIREASETAETAYGLVQAFLTMVRKREGERLDAWLEQVDNSHIQELQRFAQGILRDKEPVAAGLTQVYSNGPVEAQVQKLKVIKRQMFGRAKLPLLKQRLLHTL
jgi:transposase